MGRAAAQDLSGRVFGRLTVVARVPGPDTHAWWQVRCECGTVKAVIGSSLRRGTTQSCGCLRNELLLQRAAEYRNRQERARQERLADQAGRL